LLSSRGAESLSIQKEQLPTERDNFPSSLGYRMPAEWYPHEATWLAWPHNRRDWPGKFEPIPYVYAEIVRNLARGERVEIIVKDEAHEANARQVLTATNVAAESGVNLRFHRWPTNRGWTRDSGPIFVTRKSKESPVALTDWHFNAWAKYGNWKLDDELPVHVQELLDIPAFKPTFPVNGRDRWLVLEGGSIDVNGRGTLITTEECLLSTVQQRNPGMTREDIELALNRYLGIEKVIWLERGIVGDDTHGHVDDITRFVGPNTIVTAYEADKTDANHEILHENYKRLARMTDQDGKPLRIVKIPMPSPIVYSGQRLPASYANFYIANGRVLVPVFNDPNDRIAMNTLAELLPKHKITPIYCGDLVWGLGTIHCMTQQQPKA
jgi:agmatine deiminase